MDLSTMQANVLDMIGEKGYSDDGAGRFSQAEVNRKINLACQQVAIDAECLEGTTTQDTTSGTRHYDKPSGAVRVWRIVYDSDKIDKVSFDYLDRHVDDWEDDVGPPEGWVGDREGGFYLYKMPDDTYTVTLYIVELESQTLAASGDEPDIPASMHIAACWWAAGELLDSDDQHSKAKIYQAKYVVKVQQQRAFCQMAREGRPAMIELSTWE